jgi:hypothetical protein
MSQRSYDGSFQGASESFWNNPFRANIGSKRNERDKEVSRFVT